MYQSGEGVEQSHDQAMRYYKMAAAHGHAEGQYKVGFMLQNGMGRDRDYPQAMHWLLLAAEQENAHAQSALGFMFEHGQGVNEDESKALMYFRKAIKNGDETALKNRDMLEARLEKK
jgi:hypothetical protein